MRGPPVVLAVVALCVCACAASAQAHDPAEQPLRDGTVFLPFPARSAQAIRLLAVVTRANRAQFAIRVAIISQSRDLDEYTSYWHKPRAYARLLGGELKPDYAQRLLVVMPNGFGFNWPSHSTAPEYALLGKVPIGRGTNGLLDAAQTVVQRLAAAGGVHVSAPAKVTTPAQQNAHDRLVIILASLAALAAAVILRYVLRRRRGPRT
jgi:hypothetical protein